MQRTSDDTSLSTRVLAELSYLVLLRRPDAAFQLVGEPPAWFERFCSMAAHPGSVVQPGDISLFLEHFLADAEVFWAERRPGHLPSGPWTETDHAGRDWTLEATALCVDAQELLLVGFPTTDFQTTQRILQAARSQHVRYQQILEEISTREVLLHCIVHDLKNPLVGIKGSLDLLQAELEAIPETEDDLEAQRELVAIGRRQAYKMQALIQTIQEAFASDVEALLPSTLHAEEAPDAAAVLREVAENLTPEAALNELRLTVRAPEVPLPVVGDRARLERVLYNLVTNALRYSPAGGEVTLGARRDAGAVELYVADEGPGVPEAQRPRLFRKFSPGADVPGHAGLGLYFCRITAEAWGGTVGYAPRGEGGACFWVRLPQPVLTSAPD